MIAAKMVQKIISHIDIRIPRFSIFFSVLAISCKNPLCGMSKQLSQGEFFTPHAAFVLLVVNDIHEKLKAFIPRLPVLFPAWIFNMTDLVITDTAPSFNR